MNAQERIRNQVTANAVVLYMKGTPQSPQCGFSGATVQILKACGVQNYVAVDVLADPEIRDGIKAYSNWPTVHGGKVLHPARLEYLHRRA